MSDHIIDVNKTIEPCICGGEVECTYSDITHEGAMFSCKNRDCVMYENYQYIYVWNELQSALAYYRKHKDRRCDNCIYGSTKGVVTKCFLAGRGEDIHRHKNDFYCACWKKKE